MKRGWPWVLLGVVGCGQPDPDGTSLGSADIPAPTIPTATTPQPVDDPAWVKNLPDALPTAKAGDAVWAVVPSVGPIARVGIFTVEGVFGGFYSLSDRKGARVDQVRPAAVHPVGPRPPTKTGHLVLCHTPTTPAVLARLAEVEPGQSLQVQYDWAGVTKTTEVDHLEEPRQGIQPLAYVAYPHGGGRSRGLIVALDREDGWVLTDAGHVVRHPRTDLEALPLPQTGVKKGSTVMAYRWASGFQKATVSDVLEAGLRYRVQPEGDRPALDVFFDAAIPIDGWQRGKVAPAPSATPPSQPVARPRPRPTPTSSPPAATTQPKPAPEPTSAPPPAPGPPSDIPEAP